MCFNQLYQQKRPNIRKMIETEFVTKKQCPLPDRTAFLLSYVFKLLLFFKV